MASNSIYVSQCLPEFLPVRNELMSVLKSAGFKVFPEIQASNGITENSIRDSLQTSECAILILNSKSDTIGAASGSSSLSELQYQLIREKIQQDQNYKLILWLAPGTQLPLADSQQNNFITTLRNTIDTSTVFTNAASAIEVTDDLRSAFEKQDVQQFDVKDTEIFLISNQLDETEAAEVCDMLTDIVAVENLSIVQDSDMDYSEYCSQQIGKSKIAVVYFKESGDWALPFAQQVWKKIGGASSHVPILLIGDEDPSTNMNKKLKAPKVISLIVSGELVPLEIKVQYDKVMEILK